jgi:hypothetical protein
MVSCPLPSSSNKWNNSIEALEGFTESLAKEMDHAWNIKVRNWKTGAAAIRGWANICLTSFPQITILEPGPFKTRAHTDNTTVFPSHPSYISDPDLGSNQLRRWFEDRRGITGDPVLAARKIYELVEADEAEVPMRLQLGEDSWHRIKANLEGMLQEQKKFEKWSKSM